MDTTSRNQPQNLIKLQSKLKSCEQELSRLKREINRSKFSNNQEQDIFSVGDDIEAKSLDQRTKLIAGTERLEAGKERLSNVHQIALETEEIGTATLSELQEQRETLLRARNQIDDADLNVYKGRRIVMRMTFKAVTNKIVLILVVIILMALLGVAIWYRITK